MKPSDTDLINYLEKSFGYGLISDDNGHFALVFDGFQNVPMTKHPCDIESIFFIKKGKWKGSVRTAIKAAMKEEK